MISSCFPLRTVGEKFWNLLHEHFRQSTFLHKPVRAGPQTLLAERKTTQLREDKHSHFRKRLSQFRRCLKTVHARHAEIGQYQVRPETSGLVQSMLPSRAVPTTSRPSCSSRYLQTERRAIGESSATRTRIRCLLDAIAHSKAQKRSKLIQGVCMLTGEVRIPQIP